MAAKPSAANPAQDSANIVSAAASRKVSRMLGLALHTWEDVMIFALAVVGAFGVIVGVATFAVVRLQRAENAATREEFDRYKLDAKAESDRANAEIAAAKSKTASLEKETAEARLEQERLKAQFAWRTLSPTVAAALKAALASAPAIV